MGKKNSMENATIVVSMVTSLMNSMRNKNLKENVTNVKRRVIKHQNVDLNHPI